MRRRPRVLATGGRLATFRLPEGDYRDVWEAWQTWDQELDEWATAHPGSAELVDALRGTVPIPDEPWDITKL